MNIDFVVLWVDSSDPEWRKQYKEYKGIRQTDYDDDAHFRDWEIFRYWFRAVEKYAPWVHHVYVVTNGQRPAWLNLENEKLSLISHDEFIPKEYLPTFNARAINLNIHRIKGLSDHFVLFDDEMFINGPITPEYYFRNGLPCDAPNERVNIALIYNKDYHWGNEITKLCNVGIINSHFTRKQVIKDHWWAWHGPYLGLTYMLMSWFMFTRPYFSMFDEQHNERPFLKKTFEDVWDAEPEQMNASCSKFREVTNLNIYVMRLWQLASNNFYPRKAPKRFMADINKVHFSSICATLHDETIKSSCFNDFPGITKEEFLEYKPKMIAEFEKKYPEKCSFEL